MVVITGLLLQFNLWGQTSLTVNVATAGTLNTLINSTQMYQITDLTLTGNLNGTDIGFIRDMAGIDINGKPTNGKLVNLNLAGVNIVSGGSPYYAAPGNVFDLGTIDNSMSDYMFIGCSQLKNIIIPNSVTSIGSAFISCTGLTSITIPNSVTEIIGAAFSGCSSLHGIYCKNPIPPRVSGSCFKFISPLCNLYVPTGSGSAYINNGWDSYEYYDYIYSYENVTYSVPEYSTFNIIETDFTAITPINKDNATIKSVANGIYIETNIQTLVSVYNLSGQKVYQSVINGNTKIPLNKGVYIVNVNNESEKIIVK